MKWTPIILLMMSGLVSANIVGGMLPVSGGSAIGGNFAVVCGPPVYDYFTGCNGGYVLVSWPRNGTTLYWFIPSVTENVTASIYGFTPILCQYKINNNNWSSFDACQVGVNASWVNAVTMPEGFPVTLTVNMSSSCGWISNSTRFNVVNPKPPMSKDTVGMVLYCFFVVFLVLLADPGKKKKVSRRRKEGHRRQKGV